MVITHPTIYSQIKESYKIILVMVGIAFTIQFTSVIPVDFFEPSIIPGTSIVVLPLIVAISSFAVSRIYGGSKVFGKSYFILGLSYVAFFAGEAFFYFYMDPFDDYSYRIIPEIAFVISMPLLLTHIIINIRYFIEKLESYQKILLVIIPSIVVLGYSFVMSIYPYSSLDDFYFNLFFVTKSSIVLGFTIVAFTIFRHTALFVPWFLILIGILFSTAGDVYYRYTDTISSFSYSDPTTGLWLTSSMVMVYALYKHQKSI